MSRTIFYFHGWKSSAESSKALIFRTLIKNKYPSVELITPNILDKFSEAIPQLDKLIEKSCAEKNIFVGSSLGGFFATRYANLYNAKAVVINPAINPSEGLKVNIGANKNYANGYEFKLTHDDIDSLKSIEIKNIINPENFLLLSESNDQVLNYLDAVKFYKGSFMDIYYGGDHSYTQFSDKLEIIENFLELP